MQFSVWPILQRIVQIVSQGGIVVAHYVTLFIHSCIQSINHSFFIGYLTCMYYRAAILLAVSVVMKRFLYQGIIGTNSSASGNSSSSDMLQSVLALPKWPLLRLVGNEYTLSSTRMGSIGLIFTLCQMSLASIGITIRSLMQFDV